MSEQGFKVSDREWFQLLLLALLYPSVILATFLLLYLLYRVLGWVD